MPISSRDRTGMTLIELMVACGLTALLVTAVCAVYVYALQLWERGQAESSTHMTATLGMERICEVIEEAVYADTSMYGELKVWVPRDRTTDGESAPYWETNAQMRYRLGDEMIFYLSNYTGSTTATGDILWRRVNGVPDSIWSLVGNTRTGRVSPVQSISLQVVCTSETRRLVQVTLTVQQKEGPRMHSLTLKRYVSLRNHN